MFENYFIILYLCLIVVLQSSIGVGVLVLGTPFLLLLKYDIVQVFFILLPLSILTSFINLILIKLFHKKLNVAPNKKLIKFFLICIPSIIFGLFILKYYQKYINFKFLVSLVIIFSIILVILRDKIKYRVNFFRISILSIVGIIHGLTNSGGTLMSLALSSNHVKDNARYSITFFYFVLATFQYISAILIFQKSFFFPTDFNLIVILILGIILGNFLIRYLNESTYKFAVNILAMISSIILLLDI